MVGTQQSILAECSDFPTAVEDAKASSRVESAAANKRRLKALNNATGGNASFACRKRLKALNNDKVWQVPEE